MPSDPRCNCMALFNPVLPPIEHAADCLLRHGVMEWRSIDPFEPHESDEAWTRDRVEALDEVEAFHALGAEGYRLDARIVVVTPEEYANEMLTELRRLERQDEEAA